jgi:N-acetylmuramoyl-L-alanine amidase
MFHSKKGAVVDIIMHPTFVTFVAVLVLFYLLWFIYGLGSDFTFEKKFLATDMALTFDSLFAAKDNVVLYYLPQRTDFVPRFNYSFEKNKITVFSSSRAESGAGVYYFISDPEIDFEPTTLVFSPPFVLPRFSLLGNTFKIDDAHAADKKPINLHLLSCQGQRYDYGSILLDPAHGIDANKGSEGLVAGGLKEHILTREIGVFARTFDITEPKLVSDLTRDADFALSVDDRKSMIKDSVISINIGSAPALDNFVKAYIYYNPKKQESLKLACELVNAVSSALTNNGITITGTSIVPVIPEHESDEQLQILVEDKPGVVLEIGNINVPDTFSIENKKVIAAGILEGIKNAQK